MRKKDLIKRIEILERQVSTIKNPSLLTEAERKAEEMALRSKVSDWTEYLREQVDTLNHTVYMWKQVFYTSGIITNCDVSNRTEYQWDYVPQDQLGRNPHFKVNKVAIEKVLND